MSRRLRCSLTLALAIGWLATAALPVAAQSRGAPQAQPSSLFPEKGRPFFLAGRVVLEDGSPPPEPVPILRTCGGKVGVPLGFTDAEGGFSFGFGTSPAARVDVQNTLGADPFGSGFEDMNGCDLSAVATGYSSDSIDLSNRRLLDSPDVGTIVLHRLQGARGSVFSATTVLATKDARKAYEKGHDRARKEDYDEAVSEYEKAVQAAPRFAAAWYELGLVHQMQGHVDDARRAYQEAGAADPNYVKPYRQLAALSFQAQDWTAVAEATKRLLWLDPVSYPDAYFYDAVAHFYQGDVAAAEKSAREVVRLDANGRIPRARYVLAAILIEKKDYAGAAALLREYVTLAPPGPEVEQAKGMLSELDARVGSAPPSTPR
jgi:Flp pilus assembly protein TadD